MAVRRDQIAAAFNKVEGTADESDETGTGVHEGSSGVNPDEGSADTGAIEHTGSGDSPKEETESGAVETEKGTGDGKTKESSAAAKNSNDSKNGGKASTKGANGAAPSGETAKAPKAPVSGKVEDVGQPPVGAKRATRENWAKLPAEVRKEYTEREAEIAQAHAGIQKTRQWENEFNTIVNPYLGMIQAQNSTPMRALKNLMDTAGRLTLGNPKQKAAVVAEIIGGYQVDLQELNGILEAQIKNPGSAASAANFNPTEIPAWARPMVNFMQTAQQAQQTYQQRVEQEAQRELAEFQNKPYWAELQDDVGLVMHRATSKGVVLSLADAYAQARRMNPEIDAKIRQTEAPVTSSVSQAASVLAKARNAASSIKSGPSSPAAGAAARANGSGGEKPKTRREQLRANIDALSGS